MNNPLHTLFFLLLVLLNSSRLSAQGPNQSIQIDNSSADTILYCNIPVAVAPGIVIENYEVENPDDGIKISVVNYIPGEDTLFYTGNEFYPEWNNELGNLELTGFGSAQDLEQAVRHVFYDNKLDEPASGSRSISISLIDTDYLPETQHFYQYIPNVDIPWTEAKAVANTMDYHGLRGYLATITSEVENDFIWSKIDGVGWIGATDEGNEGNWRWDTGPEAGELFWEGGGNGQPVNGSYSNWSAGEPNNLGGEHYAHINQDPNLEAKSWNDLPLSGSGVEGSYYRVQGFVVEFGGMPGDPDVQLSTSAVIGINIRPDLVEINYDSLICGDREHQLNILTEQGVSVTLRPIDPNSIVLNESSLNPTVEVQAPGSYRFELETLTETQCVWYDTITISFRDQPDVRLNIPAAECMDADFRLFSAGNVGSGAFYEWYSNGEIIDSGVNLDTVIIPVENYLSDGTAGLKIIENTCVDSVVIPVTVIPEFEFVAEYDSIVCGALQHELNFRAQPGVEFLTHPLDPETEVLVEAGVNPVVSVPEPGNYRFEVESISDNQCSWFDTITVSFRDHPDVRLNIDSAECVDADFRLFSTGNVGSGAFYEWYANGVIIDSGVNLDTVIVPIENYLSNGTAGLKIIENTCVDSVEIPVIIKSEVEFVADYDSIVCGILQHDFNIRAQPGVEFVTRPLDPGSEVLNEVGVNPTVKVPEPGNYRFEVESISDNQCNWFDTITVSFRDQPDVRLNVAAAECVDADFRLFSAGNVESGAFYEWYSNGEIIDSGVNLDTLVVPVERFSSNGSVGLKITENTCIGSVEIPVTIKPEFEIVADKVEGCTPLNVQFSFMSDQVIDEFLWSFGDEGISTQAEPTYQFVNPDSADQNIDVALKIISDEGCENADTVLNMIRVHPRPPVDLNIDESACYEGNEEIWYKGTAGSRDTFVWDLSGIPSGDVIQDPGFSAGPLQVNLTSSPVADIGLQVISEFGCKSDTLFKTFTRKPVFTIPPDTLGGCPPFEVNLSVSTVDFTDQIDYLWNLGNGQTAVGSSVSQVYSMENQFFDISVYGVSALTGCADTLLLPGKIFVYPLPEASFTVSTESVLVSDSEVVFQNTSSGANMYEWDFGDGSFGSDLENPVHRYQKIGLFDVSLLAVNTFSCIDSASAQIAVNFDKLFPPTAFSPNAALEEDREFRLHADGIVNEGYKLLIFNRWGEVIFTSNSPEMGWDGKMKNGSNAPAGTYFWVLEFNDVLGKEHLQSGSFTLLY